jgi:hypothetical protein
LRGETQEYMDFCAQEPVIVSSGEAAARDRTTARSIDAVERTTEVGRRTR